MAWNEPGNDKNPWKKGDGAGPPDLDEIIGKLQKRAGSLFGGGGGSGAAGAGGGPKGIGIILLFGLLVWGLTGIYKIDASERGVVLRFGAYERTSEPGLHWHIPRPIERVLTVDVSEIDRFDYKTNMLTADENIVAIEMTVQYRRNDPQAYLFNVRSPDQTLRDVSESAIREVVGKSDAESVLQVGRREIADRTSELLQATLDEYGTGIEVTSVNLVNATPPAQVQAAVDDATKAREDKERLVLEAEAYANDVLPRARGAATRRLEEARAYKERVIADAKGETSRFLQLLAEYEKAPAVTRERLYMETIEEVLGGSSKVLIDAESSGNLLYLPLDKLLQDRGRLVSPVVPGSPEASRSKSGDEKQRLQEDRRSRGSR